MSKIEIRNLYLIFGKEKHKAEKMLKEGKTKEEILKVTGCTVAVKDANLSINEGEIFVIMDSPAVESRPCCAASTD